MTLKRGFCRVSVGQMEREFRHSTRMKFLCFSLESPPQNPKFQGRRVRSKVRGGLKEGQIRKMALQADDDVGTLRSKMLNTAHNRYGDRRILSAAVYV